MCVAGGRTSMVFRVSEVRSIVSSCPWMVTRGRHHLVSICIVPVDERYGLLDRYVRW